MHMHFLINAASLKGKCFGYSDREKGRETKGAEGPQANRTSCGLANPSLGSETVALLYSCSWEEPGMCNFFTISL